MPSIQGIMQCATGLLAMVNFSSLHAVQSVVCPAFADSHQSPFADKGLDSVPNLDINQTPMPNSVTTTAADVTVNKRSIAAVSWGCGRFDTFAIGTANAVYTKHRDDLVDDNNWTSTLLGGDSASPPAAVSHKPHRLDVFVRGQDHAMWNTYYNGKDWSGFRSLSGGFVLTPTAVSWGPDHIDVFGIGTHKAAYRKTYEKGSGWTNTWENLGGDWTSVVAARLLGSGPHRHLHHRRLLHHVHQGVP